MKYIKITLAALVICSIGCKKSSIISPTTTKISDSVSINFQGVKYTDAGFATLKINGDTIYFSCVKDSFNQQFYLEFTSIKGIVDTSKYSAFIIGGNTWAWIQSGTTVMSHDSFVVNLVFKTGNINASFLPHVTN